jgi:predicted glycosyltransferase
VTRVALLVTHLMGSGHLVRVLAIARALKAAGASPVVLSGGRPLPHVDAQGIDLVQLPPVAARVGDYRTLRLPDGSPAPPDYLARRAALLSEALLAARPDRLVTEHWPFGRRVLSAEFLAALDALPGVPAIASVRDVPEPPSKPARVTEALARLDRFAAVLVHGDPAILPLEASWPGTAALGARLRYTGYVCAAAPAPLPCPDTVLVSTGGGAIGRHLLALAAQAAALSPLRWHLMVGGADAASAAATLPGPALAEPARADYRARLGGAAVSVSLAGYNTAVEVALSGTPALLVPMADEGEREQAIRARAFAALPGIETAALPELTRESLAATAARLAAGPRPAPSLHADGAAETARIILAAG